MRRSHRKRWTSFLNFVVDADIQGYFDNIQRDTLMELMKERSRIEGC